MIMKPILAVLPLLFCASCSHTTSSVSSRDRIKIVVLGTNRPRSVSLDRYSVRNVWTVVKLGGGLRGAEDRTDDLVPNVKLKRANGDHITIRRAEWKKPFPKVIQPLRSGDVFVFPEVPW